MSKTEIKECRCRLTELVDAAKEKNPILTKSVLKKWDDDKIDNKKMLFSL